MLEILSEVPEWWFLLRLARMCTHRVSRNLDFRSRLLLFLTYNHPALFC